jgi:hypothetical protein
MATKIMETATLLNALNAGLRAAVDGLEQFHALGLDTRRNSGNG